MRIRRIKINQWRNFENIEFQIDDEKKVGLVCLVGANGTGKSNLLELIAACAHKLGLSQGINIPRGDPFSEPHDFELEFFLAEGVSHVIDREIMKNPSHKGWNRTLIIKSNNVAEVPSETITTGESIDFGPSPAFAANIVRTLRDLADVYFLSLDSNRAYPKKRYDRNEVAQALSIDWTSLAQTRGRSFIPTAMLYDEWMKYFLAIENQAATRHIQGIRRARQVGGGEPEFVDHFDAYRQALRKVLPHIDFIGVDSQLGSILFDTVGLKLSFDQLSGGEKEIAFLIGQIDRFGLRNGLFLLDEPELHLHPDLIRTWVTFLTSTVETGQVWLATHSLEAVEAAGQEATFILERNEETRKVDNIVRLDTRPVLLALSRAVGSPAFSISQRCFVFVEGEEALGERERFRKLSGELAHVRFIEGGSCNNVLRRVETVKKLADESNTGIRIGGVIDRDFRTDAAASEMASKNGVFVLPVHEIENFFLHPETLQRLLQQQDLEKSPFDLIREHSDVRAGSWIFQYAMAKADSQSNNFALVKDYVKPLSWRHFDEDRDGTIQSILERSGLDKDSQQKLKVHLGVSVSVYERKRKEDGFWKVCEGKQVLEGVARDVGRKDSSAMMQAVFVVWGQDESLIPDELRAFRSYLADL